MQILYRISNNSYQKERIQSATKEACLDTFIKFVVGKSDQISIICDNVEPTLQEIIDKFAAPNVSIIRKNLGSNGKSFSFQLELAAGFDSEEIVLLQEDDYLYKPANWPYGFETSYTQLIGEALSYADYVSFYDHPDKYLPPNLGGNPLISSNGIEKTEVFCTKNSHWKFTNSTTCTFASKAQTISKDLKVWRAFIINNHPHDFQAFLALGLKGRKLATSIPGRATHTDSNWISPFFLDGRS